MQNSAGSRSLLAGAVHEIYRPFFQKIDREKYSSFPFFFPDLEVGFCEGVRTDPFALKPSVTVEFGGPKM